MLKHPDGHSDLKTVISAIGGPLLFLFGTILFKHSFRGFLQLSHGAGIIALGMLAWFAGELSPLMLSILTTAIMIMVAVWESISLRSDLQHSARAEFCARRPDSGIRWSRRQCYFRSTTFRRTISDSLTTSSRSLAFSSINDTRSVSCLDPKPHPREQTTRWSSASHWSLDTRSP